MSPIAIDTLALALEIPFDRASAWAASLNTTFSQFDINNVYRQAGFLSQVAHESAKFTRLEENLNYSAEGLLKTFPRHFDEDSAAEYAHKPEEIASCIYADRMGNGDEASKDGYTYRGRGLIQITGKASYKECSDSLGVDFLLSPDLLAQQRYACLSAGWFWASRNLNVWADAQDIESMTQRINGGLIGLEERQALYTQVYKVLSEDQ